MADFGEEGAAGESGFVDGDEVGSLLFDSSNVVDTPNQGREKEWKAQQHEQEREGELGLMPPECARRQESGSAKGDKPREIESRDAVTNSDPYDGDENEGVEEGERLRILDE